MLKPKTRDVAVDSAVFRTELSLDVRLINPPISSSGVQHLRETSWKTPRWTQRLDHRAKGEAGMLIS